MNKKQQRRWQRRVNDAAKPMVENLQHLDMDPILLEGLSKYIAADVLFHLDQMKKPGVLHQIMRRKP